MRVIYSFNKKGEEAAVWEREIAQASTAGLEFIPFNHDTYLEPTRYIRAQLLDNLYFHRAEGLLRLYSDIEALLAKTRADALLVDNCPPYHPEFLRKLPVYKVLRIADGPMAAYDRDFAYLHAYDHVLYHTAAYSRDITLPEKLHYCGAKRYDWWPLAVFKAAFDPGLTETELFSGRRDVDLVFVGAFARGKMPILARIKKHFGRHCRMHGLTNIPKNVYFNLMHGFPGWMTTISLRSFGPLYRRAKVGFNIHNRGKYTVGNYRLFELPANGVMQISDGGEYLAQFFEPEKEIVLADEVDLMIEKIEYYLTHERERREIAMAGFRAVLARHQFGPRMAELGPILSRGMDAERHTRQEVSPQEIDAMPSSGLASIA